MIAPVKKSPRKKRVPDWHPAFLALLPKIRKYAQSAFRDWRPEAREDAVAEVIAYALVAFHRLVEKGKGDLAYATPLDYGVDRVIKARFLGREPTEVEDDAEFFVRAGYDFVPVGLGMRVTLVELATGAVGGGHRSPMRRAVAQYSVNEPGTSTRMWAEEGAGIIQNDSDFDDFPWPDPDGYRYGVGIAEYVRTSPHIGRGGSTREQGWPLMCMLAAWRQTGEAKYGEHAKLPAEAAMGFLERRRGTYIEVHGSVSHLGPTPFMYGILCTALRHYHLRTGDQRAAVLVARLANAVYEESHDPFHCKTPPNIDYYYSPNPYLRGGEGFTPITQLNLNIAAAQAYGAYVTQDSGLADIARRSWLAGLEGGSVYPEMAYDLAGVVWWLDKCAALNPPKQLH